MPALIDEQFRKFLNHHPELDELSDKVLDELLNDDEWYAAMVRVGWCGFCDSCGQLKEPK
jgi:hypothetical protein